MSLTVTVKNADTSASATVKVETVTKDKTGKHVAPATTFELKGGESKDISVSNGQTVHISEA
jgi:hypothetical protein